MAAGGGAAGDGERILSQDGFTLSVLVDNEPVRLYHHKGKHYFASPTEAETQCVKTFKTEEEGKPPVFEDWPVIPYKVKVSNDNDFHVDVGLEVDGQAIASYLLKPNDTCVFEGMNVGKKTARELLFSAPRPPTMAEQRQRRLASGRAMDDDQADKLGTISAVFERVENVVPSAVTSTANATHANYTTGTKKDAYTIKAGRLTTSGRRVGVPEVTWYNITRTNDIKTLTLRHALKQRLDWDGVLGDNFAYWRSEGSKRRHEAAELNRKLPPPDPEDIIDLTNEDDDNPFGGSASGEGGGAAAAAKQLECGVKTECEYES